LYSFQKYSGAFVSNSVIIFRAASTSSLSIPWWQKRILAIFIIQYIPKISINHYSENVNLREERYLTCAIFREFFDSFDFFQKTSWQIQNFQQKNEFLKNLSREKNVEFADLENAAK